MELHLTGKLRRYKTAVVARCPELDVLSQGDDDADARRMLAEAVQIFLEETARMGTLKSILKEAHLPVPQEAEPVHVCLEFPEGERKAFTAIV